MAGHTKGPFYQRFTVILRVIQCTMRIRPFFLFIGLLAGALRVSGQEDPRYTLLLGSGAFTPQQNISESTVSAFNSSASRQAGIRFAILQFEQRPTADDRRETMPTDN